MRQPRLQLIMETSIEKRFRSKPDHGDQLPGDNYDGFYEVHGLLLTSLARNIERSSLYYLPLFLGWKFTEAKIE